ncbi:GNAT family N-acetyltransferase [Aureivirga sp. CE67]|uniref:GNAT family N-acetyltransferase n=1 Tax=Aureivirga sp. CE67 TaxID=1788983 RepID=UPI0018C927B5|nr:GNAT family N-acetyltransferase [Aureivirga sp. CE67]
MKQFNLKNDFIKNLGLIGYTARIRRLNDSLMAMGKEVYKNLNLNIEPNWHLLLLLLEEKKELSASEIANYLHFTHTAIIKIAKKMVNKGYLITYKSKTDSRKQMYALSDTAIKEIPEIKKHLELIAKVHEQYVSDVFLNELGHIENSLNQKNTIIRVSELLGKKISINNKISLQPININDFENLNKLIREIYFKVYSYIWSDQGKNYINQVYSEENLKYELSDQKAKYYFITYENEIVGILRFIINDSWLSDSHSNSIKLQRLYLHEKSRGKRIGTEILKWLRKEFSNYQIWLEVMDTQNEAVEFYEKLNYKIIDKTHLEAKNIIPKYKGMFIMLNQK